MADVNLDIAAAVALQATAGTFDSGLGAVIGGVTTGDGLLFGDHRSGTRRSGIDYTLGSIRSPRAPVYGGRTQRDPNVLVTTLDACTITLPMCGPKNTTTSTPVDSDFDLGTHYKAFDALLRAAGMTGVARAGAPVGWTYSNAGNEFISMKIWDSGTAVGVRDAHAVLTLSYAALDVPSAAFAPQGTIDTGEMSSSESLPLPDFGVQATVAEPGVVNLAPFWVGGTRQFTDLTITVDPGLSDRSDSGGVKWKKGTAGTVGLSGTMVVNSADLNAEIDNLQDPATATDDFFFTVGTPASGSDPALAHLINCNNLRVTSAQPVDVAESGCRGIAVEASCTADTDGGEFSITFV